MVNIDKKSIAHFHCHWLSFKPHFFDHNAQSHSYTCTLNSLNTSPTGLCFVKTSKPFGCEERKKGTVYDAINLPRPPKNQPRKGILQSCKPPQQFTFPWARTTLPQYVPIWAISKSLVDQSERMLKLSSIYILNGAVKQPTLCFMDRTD